MTKSELIKALESVGDDEVITIVGPDGGWSNIEKVEGSEIYEECFTGIFTSDRT